MFNSITMELAKEFGGFDLNTDNCVNHKYSKVKHKRYDIPTEMEKRKKMCFSKKVYYSEKVAKEVARKVLAERQVVLHAYRCLYCGQIHLTSKENHIEDGSRIF